MAYIVVTQVGREPCRHELTRKVVIGRSSDCDIPIADQSLSRRHCSIETGRRGDEMGGRRPGKLERHPRRAMYVGQRVLQDGDEVTLGACASRFTPRAT